MESEFWDQRYADAAYAYGEAPNAFLASEVFRMAPGCSVLDVASGEGRNAAFLAKAGFRVTAIDFSAEGLRKAVALAAPAALETICADLDSWRPDRRWDAVACTFFHRPPTLRPGLYSLLQRALGPRGLLVAEWFRPEHRANGYHGGPPSVDAMVTAAELRSHFASDGVLRLQETETDLDEGACHRGPASVVRLVWQKP